MLLIIIEETDWPQQPCSAALPVISATNLMWQSVRAEGVV